MSSESRHSAAFYFDRGNAFQARGQLEDAVASYDRAIALKPDLVSAFYNRGVALHALRQLDAALASYDRAIALDPGLMEAHYNRGNALLELKQPADAAASYEQVIALSPGLAEGHYSRGNALAELRQFDAAIACYDRAIALRPDFADAHYGRGGALLKLARRDEALTSFANVLKIEPRHVDARKSIFIQHVKELTDDFPLIEKLCGEISELTLEREFALLDAKRTLPEFRVLHDLEQTGYLLARGVKCKGLREAHDRLQDAYSRHRQTQNSSVSPGEVTLSAGELTDIKYFRKQLLRHAPSAPVGNCLNLENNWRAIEEEYFDTKPELIHIDDFLSHQALAELRQFCLVSAVWNTEYPNQYLGAFAIDGFISLLHLQIAKELKQAMPKIFGGHALEQLWGFKYNSNAGAGINVHADFARINLNFWITPDEANLDPASGGMIVYDVPAPPSWRFEDYNRNQKRIYEFLEEHRAGRKTIPYRCNRAVLFNSNLFHESDRLRFREGYENRRINVTYLFGEGLKAP